MVDLKQIRAEIDKIDEQIIDLFEQRMDCAGEIAEYKIGTDKPVLDRSREKAKISRAMALVKNHGYDKAVEE